MPQNTWCHQATSHYLNQCGPTLMGPYGITKSQSHYGITKCKQKHLLYNSSPAECTWALMMKPVNPYACIGQITPSPLGNRRPITKQASATVLFTWLTGDGVYHGTHRLLGPLLLHDLTLIPPWISNHMPGKVWVKITYPFLNFNGTTVEV